MNRRSVTLGLLTLPTLSISSLAQDTNPDIPNLSQNVPLLSDHADFGGIWSSDEIQTIVAATPAPDLPQGYAEQFAAIRFKSSSDIDDFFKSRTRVDFLNWFTANVADRRYWARMTLSDDPSLPSRFDTIFDNRIHGCPARSLTLTLIIQKYPIPALAISMTHFA